MSFSDTTPPTRELLPAIHCFLREAIQYSCGESVASIIDDYPVTFGNTWKTNGDFQCFVAAAIFSRTIGLQNKALAAQRSLEAPLVSSDDSSAPTAKPKKIKKIRGGTMRVQTLSKFGLIRERKYTSAREVAEGIVSCFDCCNEETLDLIADVRVSGKSACIVITTKAHMIWHINADRFPCTVCGKFCKSARGLRYHQVLEHGLQYHDAQKTAMSTELQLILYSHVGGTAGPYGTQWTAGTAAKETARARDSLGDEGLEHARVGDLEGLQRLATAGWNAHMACDKHGNTALMWAAGEGHLHICKYLVDVCGVNVHEMKGGKYKKIRHALHWAARNGRIAVCDWLIHEKFVDVNIEADDGTVPVHFAVWMNNTPMVKWLIDIGHCDIHKLNAYGCNASQWGALNGDVEMLQLLQSYGLDLGLLNLNGHSAVHKAAVNGRLAACRWLLNANEGNLNKECELSEKLSATVIGGEEGRDLHSAGGAHGGGGLSCAVHMKADKSGNTPAMIALNNGHLDTAEWLEAFVKTHGKAQQSCAETPPLRRNNTTESSTSGAGIDSCHTMSEEDTVNSLDF